MSIDVLGETSTTLKQAVGGFLLACKEEGKSCGTIYVSY